MRYKVQIELFDSNGTVNIPKGAKIAEYNSSYVILLIPIALFGNHHDTTLHYEDASP